MSQNLSILGYFPFQNTEEALSQALYIMNEIEQRRLRISRRSVGYLVMLALNLVTFVLIAASVKRDIGIIFQIVAVAKLCIMFSDLA